MFVLTLLFALWTWTGFEDGKGLPPPPADDGQVQVSGCDGGTGYPPKP